MNTIVAVIQISSIKVSLCSVEPELHFPLWHNLTRQDDQMCYQALHAKASLLQICSEFLFSASTWHMLHWKHLFSVMVVTMRFH